MKRIVKIIILFSLIIGIYLLGNLIVIATNDEQFPNSVTWPGGDFKAPFNDLDGSGTFYCGWHGNGGHLSGNNPVTFYKQKGVTKLPDRLAYAFSQTDDIYVRQSIIWYLRSANVIDINRKYSAKHSDWKDFPVLNKGTKDNGIPDVLKKALEMKLPDKDASGKINTDEVKVELVKEIDDEGNLDEFYKFSNVKVYLDHFGDLEEQKASMKVAIMVKEDGKTVRKTINSWHKESGEMVKDKDKREFKKDRYGTDFSITFYVRKSVIGEADKIYLNLDLPDAKKFSGELVWYDSGKAEWQKMIKYKTTAVIESPLGADVEIKIEHKNPRLITTKYVQQIEHEDGSVTKITGDDGIASKPGVLIPKNVILKPTCTVDTSKKVDKATRYNLKEQNLGTYITAQTGDIITYMIRVYNIGDGTVDLSTDTDIKSDKQEVYSKSSGTKERYVVRDGQIHDYFDDECLEFADDSKIWKQDTKEDGTKYYFANGFSLQNEFGSGKIKSYQEVNDNTGDASKHLNRWSAWIKIKFKVKPNDKMKIRNNGHEIIQPDYPRLITTKSVKEIQRADGSGTVKVTGEGGLAKEQGKEYLEPKCTVDLSKTYDDPDRYNLSPQEITKEEVPIYVGDIVTYRIRVYNVGDEKIDVSSRNIQSLGEQKVGENSEEGTGPIVLEGQKIHDYFDPDCLELITDDINSVWSKGTKTEIQEDGTEKEVEYYYASASNLSNKGIIDSYKEVNDKKGDASKYEEEWSSWIDIKFKIKNNEKTKIVNNANEWKENKERIITTKQVKSITHTINGVEKNTINIIGEGGLAETLGKKGLEAECTVYKNEDIKSNKRYELTPQDLSKDINVMPGDIITYQIKVYNVGNKEVNLRENEDIKSDPEQKVGEKAGEGTGPVVIKDKKVHDYFDSENLEFVDDGSHAWSKMEGTDCYVANAERLSNNGIIKSPEETDNPDEWSSWIEIKFKVKEREGKIASIVNNSNEVGSDREVQKYLASHYNSKDGKTYGIDAEPTITVDTTKKVGDKDRVKITTQEIEGMEVNNGDKLTYGIRYYSTGTNSMRISFKVTDIPFGNELEFVEAKDSEGNNIAVKTELTSDGRMKATVQELNREIKGYDGISEVPYYDVFLTFKVQVKEFTKLENGKDGKLTKITTTIGNSLEPKYEGGTIVIPENNYFDITGKVFIDELNYANKATGERDNILTPGTIDTPVQGIKVELYEYQKNQKTGDDIYDENGKRKFSKIRETVTDSNGEYKFSTLEDKIYYCNCRGIYGCMCGFGGTGKCTCNVGYREYFVKFIYNGQEYENIKYNVDNFAGAGSYAEEKDKDDNDLREEFNNQFNTIDSSNSEDLSLMKRR